MNDPNASPSADPPASPAKRQSQPTKTELAKRVERHRDSEATAEIGIDLQPGDARIVGTPARSVGFTLSSLGHAVASEFRNEMKIVEMEPREFALLRAIAPAEGISQQALAERLGVQPSRVVTMVDTLERRGLIERHPNPDDRRARELYMTEKGRNVLGNAFVLASELERRLCGGLSQSEREQLLEMLHRVERQLELVPGIHAAGIVIDRD